MYLHPISEALKGTKTGESIDTRGSDSHPHQPAFFIEKPCCSEFALSSHHTGLRRGGQFPLKALAYH